MLDILLYVLAAIVLAYTPISVGQLILFLRGRSARARAPSASAAPPVEPRRTVVVVICTNGENPLVVEKLLRGIRDYDLPVASYVIKEAHDRFRYSAAEMVVPAAYRTPNGSLNKERALQYGIEQLHAQGHGRETYICHLDDDSLVSREYLLHVFSMEEEAGQGSIRLREHGHHLLSTLADLIRVFDCEAWCTFFNQRNRPKAVHGEGLVIRADVEREIGWDYGTYCGEDFLMGQLIVAHGYRFGHIPHAVSIASPLNRRDFFRQRRRWMYGILWSRDQIGRASRGSLWWVLYRYGAGWMGFVGLFLMGYGLLFHPSLPLWLLGLSTFNFVSYCFSYQVGAYRTLRRYMPSVLALQLVVALYEGLTLPYALLWRPDRRAFDVIQKV
jgi:cellulose synthase/poly-beta-1,6-N-acetylglucosamine synthase-like glycosyltransferase